ncbi:hypothetical protein BGZ94_007855 [Podila epigama]|nr:hypothetical protein BGZ94_007855 [Podila epigama]
MFQRPAVTHRISYVLRKDGNRNAHLLGVNALALDTTSVTSQPGNVPGGILYTGGRDGMIAAWDLHLEAPVPRDIPGETVDNPKGLPPSTFRQSFNHHTDWVNDIVLCHNGETLISASSDRTVKLVRPHSHHSSTAHIIGTHEDYVKTLAYAPGPGWVASGGLDKTVRLWDIKEGRTAHFTSLGHIPETSSKASVYALACNPAGTVLATGSPEKIVRVWDPRSGQRITKFAGHTDNIRALLISESGDTILSASSDTTIKLWSLTAQRCINTFTMHSDSVWSLYSDHPQLSTFYGGGKDGLVTKTEVNRYNPHGHEYDDSDSGQCVIICKADAGVARLVAHDNARIWTATSSSSIYQWPDIPTRSNRSEEMTASIVPANILKMNLDDATFVDPTPEHYYPTSTVYSAASLASLCVGSRGDRQSQHSSEDDEGLIAPIFDAPENVIVGEHGLIKHSVLNNRRMVVTEDKCGEIALWDLIKCVQLETFTGRKLEEVVKELNTVESVPTWCTIDTRIGALTVHLDEARCFDAEVYCDEIEEIPHPERPEDQRIIVGKWVLRNLFDSYIPVHIDAYEREVYRQQHPEEFPTVPSSALSVPTTVVTNERNEVVTPNNGVNSNSQENVASSASSTKTTTTTTTTTPLSNGRPTINTSPEGLRNGEMVKDTNPSPSTAGTRATSSPQDTTVRAEKSPSQSPSTLPTSSAKSLSASPSIPSTPTSFSPTVTAPNSSSSNGFMGRLKHSVKKLARTPSAEQRFENGRPLNSRKNYGQSPTMANISIPSGSQTPQGLNSPSMAPEQYGPGSLFAATALTPTQTTFSGTGSSVLPPAAIGGTTTTKSTSTGGLGVLKLDDEHSTSDTTSSHSLESVLNPGMSQPPPSTISIRPPHPPFTPPTVLDCPLTVLPPHVPVIISEQSREASSSVDLYRGSVGSLVTDYIPLVQIMPNWVLEVILKNTIPIKETAKVSFVLRPHHDQEGERGPLILGELPGGNPRLTAPRMLRIRKVMGHVAEKLNIGAPKWLVGEASRAVLAAEEAQAQAQAAEAEAKAAMTDQEAVESGHSRQNQVLEPVYEEEVSHPPSQQDGAGAGTMTEGSSSSSLSTTTTSPPPPSNTAPTFREMTAQEAEQARICDEQRAQQGQEKNEQLLEIMLRPENWLEILCNDQVLSPTMTLATIRSHYWKTSSDVVLTYRYKLVPGAVIGVASTATAAAAATTLLNGIGRSSTPVST